MCNQTSEKGKEATEERSALETKPSALLCLESPPLAHLMSSLWLLKISAQSPEDCTSLGSSVASMGVGQTVAYPMM